MSEGGRKVWNREQLEALNSGAVFLAPGGSDGRLQPVQITRMKSIFRDTPDSIMFFEFGDERDISGPTEHDYPIEVIWEPNE